MKEQKSLSLSKDILIITSEFPPLPGGIGNHAFCLAKELSNLDYKVKVLTEIREQNPGSWQELVDDNKDIVLIGLYRRKIIFLTYCLRILFACRLIRRTSYKAVFYSGKFSVWLNALMPETRSIVVIHGSEIKQKGIAKVLFRRGLQRAGKIVCVSSFTRSQLLANYEGIDRDKIVVINNGFRTDLTIDETVKKIPDNKKVNLVTVGGIHKRKGQFNVVRALPRIIEVFPDMEYRIVGLPLEKDGLKHLISSEKVDKYVAFHHGLNDEQVKNVLTDSDIFMMLSEHLPNGDFEGFGIAIIEAMALGLPAIGTQNSGIADAIKDGYSGKLVNPRDTDDVINSLNEIISNYRRYSDNAKNWASGFQWKYKAAEYQALINKL